MVCFLALIGVIIFFLSQPHYFFVAMHDSIEKYENKDIVL